MSGALHPVLLREARGCFDFFWTEANTDTASPGCGLVRDTDTPRSPCSIAAAGFGLGALAIGAERGWVGRGEAAARARRMVITLLQRTTRTRGFFFHFLDLGTAARAGKSEVSVIDTALLAAGALAAGEYFGGNVQELAGELVEGIEWPWYRDPARDLFRMGYWPERGFDGWWGFADEQQVMYVLGAGSPSHPVPSSMYAAFARRRDSYGGGARFIHSTVGSLFTYQFSHAWIDYRGTRDADGVDWFQNSVDASIAARRYCVDNPEGSRTYGAESWGLTACHGPRGYSGSYGAPPSGPDGVPRFRNDGTIPPCGAAGSLPFTPEESTAALVHYASIPRLAGPYGFVDAYNLDEDWYDTRVIGIDKGITLLMIENLATGLPWRLFGSSAVARRGREACGISAASP